MAWNIGSSYGPDKVEIINPDEGIAVATVWVKRGVPDRETGRVVFVDDPDGLGRAKLIAAAPDLAEAATDFARLTMVERFPLTDIAVGAAYERLRAALAKAGAI